MIDLKTLQKVKQVTITCMKDRCKVHPSAVLALPGSMVPFVNTTNMTVHVQVAGIGTPYKILKNARRSLKMPSTGRWEIYPYAVFCYKRMKFCTGSDMPIIIVPPTVPTRN